MRTVSVYRPLRWSHIALNSSMYTRWWKKKEEINYCSCARCISNLTTEENWLWLRRIEIFCLWARSNRHVVLILYRRCVHDFILFIQFFIANFFPLDTPSAGLEMPFRYTRSCECRLFNFWPDSMPCGQSAGSHPNNGSSVIIDASKTWFVIASCCDSW